MADCLDLSPCNSKDILLRKMNLTYDKEASQKNVRYSSNVSNRLAEKVYRECGAEEIEPAYELSHDPDAELMRTRYCIRIELGMCPVHQKASYTGDLFLLNNGRRFALGFDCRNCEMTVKEA